MENVEALRKRLTHCDKLYPSFCEQARAILDPLADLIQSEENPILTIVENILSRDAGLGAAILVKDARLISKSQQIASESTILKGLEVLSPAELRKDRCFRVLVVVGPASWYPDHVVSAPRTSEIHIVQWGWIDDHLKPSSVFICAEAGTTYIHSSIQVIEESSPQSGKDTMGAEVIKAADILPQIDWDRVLQRHSARDDEPQYQGKVRAAAFLLEGGKAVFLDADDASSGVVIDLEEEPTERVKRLSVKSIEPGMFLLLRTGSGGDFIATVADKIMGDKARGARRMQLEWKVRLVQACKSRGFENTATDLRIRGCAIANTANILRWVSLHSIRTRTFEDFNAILEYVGLGREATEYWLAMEAIAGAHVSAGQFIRNLLLREVQSSNLTNLEKFGVQEFQLPEAGCGSLTAFRVTGVSPDTVALQATRLHQVFEL